MATRETHLFPYEVSHMIDDMPYVDDFQLIIFGDTWASMICSVGGEILGDLVFILRLEGKCFAAQEQQFLYTYHEWREGQHGVGYIVYHEHIFIPPSLPEPKVEDSFQELPSWEVAHFVWMIAWGWRIHMRKMFLNTT